MALVSTVPILRAIPQLSEARPAPQPAPGAARAIPPAEVPLPPGVRLDGIPFFNDAAILTDDIIRATPGQQEAPCPQTSPWPESLRIIRPDDANPSLRIGV